MIWIINKTCIGYSNRVYLQKQFKTRIVNIDYLLKLDRKEKMRIVQLLWDDIANDNNYTYVSVEHKKVLDERMKLLENGKAEFKSLEEIELKFNSLRK
jgi:putative addiction module component (TIGR02574 family)